jgi:branched-chain amino acid transport system permease protein
MKSIFGTFLGVIVIYGVPNLWLKDLFSVFPGVAYVFSGALIIGVVLFYPYGLIHLGTDFKKLWYNWKAYRERRRLELLDIGEEGADDIKAAGDQDE